MGSVGPQAAKDGSFRRESPCGECGAGSVSSWLRAQPGPWRPGITHVTIDLSASYAKAVRDGLPDAVVVAGRFHLVRLANDALTAVRQRVIRAHYDRRRRLPGAEVYFMGNILHAWDETEKQLLIDKVYAALPSGGILVVVENIIDTDRRGNTFGLLMSQNMLIETPAGSDCTGTQFDEWACTAGFARTEIRDWAGPSSAAIAYKNTASEWSVGSA